MAKINKKYLIILILFIAFTLINSNNFYYTKADVIATQNNIKYDGKIEALSFTTLMSFPDKALHKNNSLSSNFDESKITVNEFKNILEELYINNYILVDIYDVIDRENMTKKDLYLPQNKKPIILTFDNVTYTSNYQNLGQIDKIIIDRNNNLASYTTKKSIQDRIQYDNEFLLILENFINKHKDFSYNNARGIIFLTGENGILGYNTNHKNASSKYEQKRVCEVIRKLKNLGWRFGSNNYTYKDESTKTDMEFAKELSLWNNEIKEIIGTTNLYAFPYGNYNKSNISKLELLISNYFNIFFANNLDHDLSLHKDICFVLRKDVNGKNLRDNPEMYSQLFNAQKVYDHENRKINFE